MTIIIDASSLSIGGGNTIMRQVYNELYEHNDRIVFIFSSSERETKVPNVYFIEHRNVVLKLIWHTWGMAKWIRKNRIKCDLLVSLQNLGYLNVKCDQFVYYHQAIPLSPFKWSVFKKDERILAFYKYIYPLLVRIFNKNVLKVIVQSSFMKREYGKFFNYDYEKIVIKSPVVNIKNSLPYIVTERKINILSYLLKYNIIYPATLHKYKNHSLLFDALSILFDHHPELRNSINLHLPGIPTSDMDYLYSLGLSDSYYNCYIYANLSRESMDELYKISNLLVFPSYIESFGLPLVEAANYGIKILAPDLEYAHSTVNNYDGAVYIRYDDPVLWAEEIYKSIVDNKTFPRYSYEIGNWSEILVR